MEAMRGKRVLVVEDEYLLADDLRSALEDAGAEVVGPVPDVAGALTMLEAGEPIDAALLDINLNGEPAFPVADAFVDRAIPFAFTTGYDEGAVPARFASVARLEKPTTARVAVSVLIGLLG